MLTRSELAALLREVNVEDVAKLAGVSTKTVYRLRWEANSPSIETARKLIDAANTLRRSAKRAKKAA